MLSAFMNYVICDNWGGGGLSDNISSLTSSSTHNSEPASIWRILLKPSLGDVSQYCISNNVAAMGWCFCDLRDDSYFEKMCQQIQTWKDYVDCSNVYYDYVDQSVKSLHDEVNAGDVIWMRSEGRYYFARTVNESKWQFNHEARNIDAANQLTHVNWKEVKDVSPVSESLRRQFEVLGPTFRRIQKQDIWDFTLKMLRGQEE